MAKRKRIHSRGVRFQGNSKRAELPQSFSGYDGANRSVRRGNVWWSTLDSRLELDSFSRDELLRRCRWLRANVGVFRGLIGNAAMLIGWLTPRARSKDEEWNEAANENIKARLMSKLVFDAGGKYNFKTAQRMMTEKALCDADLLTVFSESAGKGAQFAFYEAHQLRNPKNADRKVWHDGVRVNPMGRHVAYGLGDGNRMKTVSARDAHYFGFFESPGHHRAHPPAAHAVNHAIDITEVWADTKHGIKNAALLGVVSEIDSNGQRPRTRGGMEVTAAMGIEGSEEVLPSGNASETAKVKTEQVWAGGQVPVGAPGEKWKVLTDGRQHPNQAAFVEVLIRDMAMGLKLPPEVVWHMQKLTGPGVRYVMEFAGRWIEEKQLELLDWCHRVVVYHLCKEIKAGRLEQPEDDGWMQRIGYIPRRSLTIDRGKESQQRMNEIYAGAGTFGDWYADVDGADGRDKIGERIVEVCWAKQEVARQAEKWGVDCRYDEVFRPQQGAATPSDDDSEPKKKPDDDDDE